MTENQRYLALDVLRGITVCFMIIVNSPGSWDIAYSPLLHATWHGFTPTDLVFPSFLFAVGNAMAFALHKYEAQGASSFWRKTIKRTVIIFMLGFLMYWYPFYDFSTNSWKPLSETRILGVLQRIALCYFFASVIVHYGKVKAAFYFSVFALVSYWILLLAMGGQDPYSMSGYYGNILDFAILGEKHLYNGEGVPFDPEGLLSTLPAVVNVLAGYMAGRYIKEKRTSYESIAKLLMAGAVLVVVALAWDMVFPINKKIWTSSFVLLTVGLDLVLLALLMYVLDIATITKGSYFFLVFGRNPLIIYLLSEVLLVTLYLIPIGTKSLQEYLYADVFGSFMTPINASLFFALFFMMITWCVGYVLDKQRIYIKV